MQGQQMTIDGDLVNSRKIIDAWVDGEFRYWSEIFQGVGAFEREFERLNIFYPSIFVLDIRCGHVAVRHKPGQIAGDGSVIKNTGEVERVFLYRDHIEQAIALFCPAIDVTIAIDTHDIPLYRGPAPVFSFQKKSGSRAILLPDVDFMYHYGYQQNYADVALEEKRPLAIFAGSSSGGGILSTEDVELDRSERLGLARDFANSQNVIFRICKAVQCDSPETADHLSRKGYFGSLISWEEQLKFAFLLSVDGNGATCSRVVNSLRSRSVLLKMASHYSLYYFRGLRAWEHYIPVDCAEDVEDVIELYKNGSLDVEPILDEANLFFQNFLVKEQVQYYTASILEKYANRFSVCVAQGPSENLRSVVVAGLSGHFSGLGDIQELGDGWLCAPSGQALEELTVNSSEEMPKGLLKIRARPQGLAWGEWAEINVPVGSRGQSRALTGIELRLAEGEREAWKLICYIRLRDGTTLITDGITGPCETNENNPITAIRLGVVRRN